MNMFVSWKTTTAGLVTILGAVFALKKTFLPAWQGGDFMAIAPAVTALFTGIGLVCARDNNVTSEQAGAKGSTLDPRVDGYAPAGINNADGSLAKARTPNGGATVALALAAAGLFVLAACAPLQPGADTLVVRVEQAETGMAGTLDLVVKTDDVDRAFWQVKAPQFHAFAEFLRAPVILGVTTNLAEVNGTNVVTLQTNALPRGLAMVRSLDVVKRDYQAGRASSNAVVAVLATSQGLVSEAAKQLGSVTNLVWMTGK